MKRVLEGVRYDTDKAIKIGSDTNGLPVSDFSYWWAGLYKAPRSDRYFLAGEGGAMSMFGSVSGDNRGYGERIQPMTKKEALAWAEEHLEADIIDEFFGDMIEDA